jgi:hypothetical protein
MPKTPTPPPVLSEFDLTDFAPTAGDNRPPVPDRALRQIAEQSGFPSRSTTNGQRSTYRQPMVYRTGRNTVFSVKTTPQTVDAFYDIAQSQGWKAGETFERALQALQEKLAAAKG